MPALPGTWCARVGQAGLEHTRMEAGIYDKNKTWRMVRGWGNAAKEYMTGIIQWGSVRTRNAVDMTGSVYLLVSHSFKSL